MPQRVGQRPEHGLAAERHNLPAPHRSLIGREHDSATVRDLVLLGHGRLVTLTGTGGCGKTQLALLAATGLVDTFPAGVWLVELATVQAPHLVPYAVASVLGCRERAGEALIDTLVAYLRTREVLLVLDNCEHLIEACASLAERLLSGCPRVRLLATSRERLRIGAEQTWRVPSLAGPDPRVPLAPAELLAYPAVRLFVERAQAVQPDFALTSAVASSVANICGRLEGLPLAIELAAARVPSLSPAQILERLDDAFQLLVGGSRTAPTRQQTLRATLDWSHGLLSDAEQALFRRLAVFGGGCSLEAAEAVCTDTAVQRVDVVEVLSHLVDKSLVVAADERDGRSRYRLLEPIRQYARQRLLASSELDTLGSRHAAYFLGFAEGHERDASVGGAHRNHAARALEAEYANLLLAIRRAVDTQDADLGLRLAWTLQFVWKHRLPAGEGRPWVEEVLALPGAQAPTRASAVSVLTAAYLAWGRGDYPAADRYYADAVPLARRLGDPWILFVALCDQGLEAQQRGDYAAARSLWQEALAVTRTSGDQASEAITLVNLGRLDIFEGNYAPGQVLCQEGLTLGRHLDDVFVIWVALNGLALGALAQGELASARSLSGESLIVQGTAIGRTGSLHVLGEVAIAEGQYATARQHLLEALALLSTSADPVATAQVVEALGHLAARTGQPDLALRLAAAAEAAGDTADLVISRSLAALPHLPIIRDLRDRWLIPLRNALSRADADRWWAEGRALSLEEAVALAETSALAPVSTPERPAGSPLTPRQQEVALLIADGLTNRQIAERLVVTERAAAAHVEHILNKLGVGSRTQIAVWAAERGLLASRG